jgi:LytS/YehU family sensor histidine kinase
MALLYGVGSLHNKDMHICNKPNGSCKVNVEVANGDNMMQHHVSDKVSVYSPYVKDSSMLGLSNLFKTRHFIMFTKV